MHDAVWQPGQHIKDDILVSRQDVAEVGTVEDVFKCWKNSNPDRRTIGTRDKPAIHVVSSNAHRSVLRHSPEEALDDDGASVWGQHLRACVKEDEPGEDRQGR